MQTRAPFVTDEGSGLLKECGFEPCSGLEASKADYFLQYTDGYGHKNGTIYNEGIEFGDQFFWDHRNPEASAYFVFSVLRSVDSPFVDGTFTDDVGGCCNEHPHAQANMRLADNEIVQLRDATTATHNKLVDALIKAGKYNWQAFGGGDSTSSGLPAPQGARCAAWMHEFCAPEKQQLPMMMAAGNASNSSIAGMCMCSLPHRRL